MSTYVYVKRSKIRYNYKNPRNVEFKRVRMAAAFNMCHRNTSAGWERAKKGEYEEWLKATKKNR